LSPVTESSTLLLDPFEKLFVLSRGATAVNRRDRSLKIDRTTFGILPFSSSFAFDCIQIGEAISSAARGASTNERINILFAGERGPVNVGYEVAMRSEVGVSGLGKLIDDVSDDRHMEM
jgi:hypothetical protein